MKSISPVVSTNPFKEISDLPELDISVVKHTLLLFVSYKEATGFYLNVNRVLKTKGIIYFGFDSRIVYPLLRVRKGE